MSGCYALIAGGGTAGHVEPALAIGRALVGRGHDPATIHFVGSRRGIDRRLVPAAGFGLTLLPGRGIERRVSWRAVGAVLSLLAGVVAGFAVVVRRRPRVVVSVGGYAAVPCAVAAAVLRVPLVLAEQNAVPSAANRLVGRVARAAAVPFPGVDLPRAEVTGNPVRDQVLAATGISAADARRRLELPADRRVVAAFGGSLGARRINDAVLDALPAWADRRDLAVRHVVGDRDGERAAARLAAVDLPAGGLCYQQVRYESQMDLLYAAADLALCRAGGNTVAELAVLGVPAILVPLPIAPNDAQGRNAAALVDAGAAVLVRDEDLDGERLQAIVDELLGDPARLAAMAAAAAGLGRADAADRVAALVERHARPARGSVSA